MTGFYVKIVVFKIAFGKLIMKSNSNYVCKSSLPRFYVKKA